MEATTEETEAETIPWGLKLLKFQIEALRQNATNTQERYAREAAHIAELASKGYIPCTDKLVELREDYMQLSRKVKALVYAVELWEAEEEKSCVR